MIDTKRTGLEIPEAHPLYFKLCHPMMVIKLESEPQLRFAKARPMNHRTCFLV